jgi:formylglycine-generating enzyme required for sulfatase activity
MNYDRLSLEIARRVLTYSKLAEGASYVKPEGKPGSVLPNTRENEPSHFHFELAGLLGNISERLILQGEADANESEEGQGSTAPALRSPIAILQPCGDRATNSDKDQLRLALDDFFVKLVSVPRTHALAVLGNSRQDFIPKNYKERFQDRRLEVLHSQNLDEIRGTDCDAMKYLTTWASSQSSPRPLILLGERGSGKTWQLFKLSEHLLDLHWSRPWQYGPPTYLPLRDEASHFKPFGVEPRSLAEAVLERYSGLSYLLGARLLEAFWAAGHSPLFLDGFEEMSQVLSGAASGALEALSRICSELPSATKYIIACRSTQFGTLDEMLNMKIGGRDLLGEKFDVVQLRPFGALAIKNYLIASGLPTVEGILRRVSTLGLPFNRAIDWDPLESSQDTVRICCSYPALLAAIVERLPAATERPLSALEFISAALVEAVLAHNLELGNATQKFFEPGGMVHTLRVQERLDLLGELAWTIVVRGEDSVDLLAMVPLIRLRFGLSLNAVAQDLRTQTLFENALSVSPSKWRSNEPSSAPGTGRLLQFAIRSVPGDGSKYFPKSAAGIDLDGSRKLSPADRGLLLNEMALRKAPVGVTSVTGAFLVARHISRMLSLTRAVPQQVADPTGIASVERWRFLGEAPLGVPAASLLREMLELKRRDGGEGAISPQSIASEAILGMTEAAKRENFSVFSPCFRYIGHNLESMGLLSTNERRGFDPWVWPEVMRSFRQTTALPALDMVLVPAPSAGAIPTAFSELGVVGSPIASEPFFLATREITNAEFYEFLQEEPGTEWRVDRMTLAGRAAERKPSRFSALGNEYHLYFWQRSGEEDQHLPDVASLADPVVYVSWFACVAFLNWLSERERRSSAYSQDSRGWRLVPQSASGSAGETEAPGFRLPTVAEWSWTARCCRLDVQFPWEVYPLAMPEAVASAWLERESAGSEEAAAKQWFRRTRAAYRQILTTSTKEHLPVLSDPAGPMGVSGLMGNVKEWCNDVVRRGGAVERAVLGSTSLLGTESYRFNYGTSLPPRNSNPDVGFRVCRSLSKGELDLLRRAEKRVAAFSSRAE